MDLSQRLRATMAIDPGAEAIEQLEHWATWGELEGAITGLDDLLHRHGLGAGARVAILPRTRAGSVAAFVGLLATDRCAVFVSPLQSDGAIVDDLERLGCGAVVADVDDWQRPGLLDAATRVGIAVECQPAVAPPRTCATPARVEPSSRPGIALEMLTSGTTGPAKRIDLTYASLGAALTGAQVYEGRSDPAPPRLRSGVLITWNPLVHASGVYDVVAAMFDGRRLALLERFEPAAWSSLVRRHGVKTTGMTPTALRMVIDAEVPPEELTSLVAVVCGSARLDVSLHEEWVEAYGIPILEVYGATEFAGAVAGWTIADHREFMPAKLGSQGRAQPGVDLRVVDASTGAELPTDSVGLLEVRSTQTGTHDWVRTSDLASIDADGFLWVRGRADDVIVRGGFKVDPGKVKLALEQHPGIFEAIVVGLPDPRLGEVPVAAVEVAAGAVPPTEDELLELARTRLARYEIPLEIKVVEALPRTPSTKASRPEVKLLFSRP